MYLFLVLFIQAAIPSMCKGQPEKTCDVFPKDKYIEVGSNIDVVCQTSCVRGKILWKINKRPVDESLSNTINSSHTVLTLRNFTHHSATLQCYSAETLHVLGGTNIRTYMKPSKISCILHHKSQLEELQPDQFTCSWEHQINPPLEVNYAVLSASLSHRAQREICRSRRTECTSDVIDLLSESIITVRAKTAAWEAYSDPQTFNPYHILKMIRPKLNVAAFSDRVLVEWKRPNSNLKCHCQVNYSKAVSERTPVRVLNKTLREHEHGNMIIEEVESCSNYTFSVRCALDEAPWSDWSEKTLLTKLNKSHVKLRLWRTVAEPEKNGVRKVHAMWTEIPSTCQETFTYTIKRTPYREHMMGVNYTDTLCGKSTCDVAVDRDAHRINLTVFHNETLLVEDSVYIPAIGESLPQVTNIQASTLEGVILVSWNAPIQPVSGYMIDWTDGGNQYFWKETKYTNATLSDLLDKKPYNITVTPLFNDKTGDGTQALHICSRVGDPGNVTIQVQANDKTALVSWSVKSQEACSGVIVSYTVFYSIQGGPQLNVTVDGSEQVTSLKDLNPDTQYSVYVNATARTGSTKSSETLFKTKRFGPGLITTVVICGSIVIILVLCLGLCFAVQWKKFREKPVPNPGRATSVKLWPAPSCQERMFQAFSNPSESICDRVYTEETPLASTSPPATGCNGDPASDQTEENVYPTTLQAPDEKNKDPVETQTHLLSPDDSTALLTSENQPYRSQTSVESPVLRSSKQCKRAPVKQPEKMAAAMLYVTLDMFEQGVNGNATITTIQDSR